MDAVLQALSDPGRRTLPDVGGDACTSPARLARRFAEVDGVLRPGGRGPCDTAARRAELIDGYRTTPGS